MKALLRKIRQILRDRRTRRLFTRVVSGIAAFIVFVTTYALVLPAITMESEAACGIPAHQHDDSCYEEVLTCDLPESDGHTHDESCYTVTEKLVCGLEEHVHSPEYGCYDKEGNLICQLQEHTHTADCYKEEKTLSCGLEESEGHHHDASCYDKILTCGLEAHVHSAECYRADHDSIDSNESSAVAASTGAAAVEIGNGDANSALNAAEGSASGSAPLTDDSSAAATTGVLPETIAEEKLSEGYVPTLDSLNMEAVLTQKTGFYYYHAGDNAETPANSEQIDSWKKFKDNDPESLAPADLVRAYFAFSIPAGSLNETNQIARYRLPANLHLTDDQIIAINQNENGIAGQFINYDTLEITDTDKYNLYLGAEAVEGTRTPDQTLADDAQEYISAVVKAENVYDEEGTYLGQDLIFIFTPYTIEKNQNTYDSEGNPTSAGHKVTGWFACDFNMDQIDWVETSTATEADADLANAPDNTSVEKTAEILFAAQDNVLNIKEISQTLKLVETIEAPEDAAAEDAAPDEATDEALAEEAPAEENAADEAAEAATTEETASDATEADLAADNEKAEAASTDATADAEKETEEEKFSAGTLTATGDSYKITLDYTAEAEIPADSKLHVTEITAESDPEAYEACLKQAQDQVVSGDKETVNTNATRFFDIEIQKDGEKVEPKTAVKVNIQLDEVAPVTVAEMAEQSEQDQAAQKSEPTVLHFAKDGVETIEATTAHTVTDGTSEGGTESESDTAEGKQIQFETSSFSIYGVVYTSTITTTFITASGETYEITVTYDKDAEIPEGASLDVSEIKAGTKEYNTYLQDSAMQLGIVSSDLHFARFFDITILDKKGEKVEPKAPVQVGIVYKDALEIEKDQSLNIVHFAENGTEIISDANVSEDGKEITYEQSSFSVTGTIIHNIPQDNQSMILVHDTYQGQNRYYIVNNDASLTEVGYDSTTGTVSVIEPMMWTFDNNSNPNRHIYFNSEATGFGTNQVASDYYRRYLDPTASTENHNAYTEENKDVAVTLRDYNPAQWWNQDTGTYVQNNYVGNRNNALNETALSYDDSSHTISQGNTYFTIERDEDGKPVRLVGQEGSSDAAYFEFATASQVPSGLHLENAVNHIDISIQGSAKVDIPLAYGSYYGPNGAASPAIKVVTENEKLQLGEAQMLDPSQLVITAEDMKRAEISASSPTHANLDDAFYITGFSANTGTAYSTPQVRIEGRFLVADIPDGQNYNGHSLRHVEGNLYDGWGWFAYGRDWNYVNAVRSARLNNKVTYTVTVVKPLQYYLTDPELGLLYDDEGNPIVITVDVTFSASFNYWDDENSANGGNECPPIQGNDDWKAGDIPNHDMSGMDFKLGGDADDPNSPLLAIEITKVIQDEHGNRIELKNPVTNTFEIWQNKTAARNGVKGINVDEYTASVNPSIYDGYSALHDKSITVSDQGMALVYDYNVTDGMYYIVEKSDPDNLPRKVTDTDGNEWNYVKTYIETEYVRRGDQYDDRTQYPNPMHVTQEFTLDGGDSYKSVPEVVGKFTTLTGEEKKSGFLEFFVYNIYAPKKTELTFNKVWSDAAGSGTAKTITINGTQYNLSDLQIEVQLQRYIDGDLEDENTTKNALGESVCKLTLDGAVDSIPEGENPMVYETSDWSCIWKNLPSGDGSHVYTYSAKEISVKDKDGTVLTPEFIQITDRTGSNGVTITNTLDNTDVTLEKQWDPEPAGNWSATFQIQSSRRQITDAQGKTVTNQPWLEWEQAKSTNDANVPNQTIDQDTPGAKITLQHLPKYSKDANGIVWEYKYRAHEVSFFTADGENYQREVAQEGDAAHGYAIVVRNKRSNTTTVTAEKKWKSNVDSSGNSGTGGNNGSTGTSGSNSGNITDPNVTAVEFTLYELITDGTRPDDAVKIGVNWYKPATAVNESGTSIPLENNPQKVNRGSNDGWTGTEKATWASLSRDKTYYVRETGIYYGDKKASSTSTYVSGGEVTVEGGQRTATIFNAPLTLQVTKKWNGLTSDEEWPNGYTVEYKIEREYSYKNGSNTVTGKDNEFSFVVTKDNENSQYLLKNDQRTVNLTGMFPAGGVKDGNIVSYTYFVTETKVNTPKDSGGNSYYTINSGERKVFLKDQATVGLLKADLINQLTSVNVKKQWTGNHASDQATVTLYKYVETTQPHTRQIIVKVAEDNEVVDDHTTGPNKTNLGNRTVYVVMDGDEANRQELTKDGTVTFDVADDADHYFSYSLSDTDNGRLTVTGPGSAHAGETIKVAVQDNTSFLKTITVNLQFTNNNPDQDKFNSGDYIDVQINGQSKRLNRDNRTATFQVLGEGTFPVSYTTSRPEYLSVIDVATNSLAKKSVVVGNEGAVINIRPLESQPTKIGFQAADLDKWTDEDYVKVIIDDGDNGSITFKKGDNGTVKTLNLGNSGTHTLSYICGGNALVTTAPSSVEATHEVTIHATAVPGANAKRVPIKFELTEDSTLSSDHLWNVNLDQFYAIEDQNNHDYKLNGNNTQLSINNTNISSTDVPNTLSYKVTARLQNSTQPPKPLDLSVTGTGCTANYANDQITITNITSDTPTVNIHVNDKSSAKGISPQKQTSIFARLLGAPIVVYAEEPRRTNFTEGNALTIIGVEELPQGAVAIDTYTGTGNSWEYTWKDLPVVDENGNAIHYYVKETSATTTASYESVTASHTIVHNDDGSYSVVINNTTTGEEPQTGSLNITKAVTNGANATGKDFAFEVELKNSEDAAFTDSVKVTDKNRAAESVTPDNNGKITVVVTGTGTASITDLPEGTKYTVTEPATSIPNGWKLVSADGSTGTIIAGGTTSVTITNTPTQYEFSKVWKNKDGQTYDTWQKDITVTLYRKSSGTQEEAVKVISISGSGTTISTDDETHTAALTITPEAPSAGKENVGYKYTITGEGLTAYDNGGNEYTYYVKEGDVDFYSVTYGVFDGTGDERTPRAVNGNTSATDGGVIINTPIDTVELPSTGGPGTKLFYLFGGMFIIVAAALLGRRRLK